MPDTGVIFQKTPDGGVSISFQGNITIDLPQGMADAAGFAMSASPDTSYRLITDGTPTLREPSPLQQEVPEVITHHITFADASESILSPSEEQSNFWYQSAPPSLSAANRAALSSHPVTHPDHHRPIHFIFRNRKTKNMSLSGIPSVILAIGCDDPGSEWQSFT